MHISGTRPKQSKKYEIIKAMLYIIGALGLITIAVALPGAAVIAKQFGLNNKYSNRQINRSLKVLKKNGLISIRQEGDKTAVRLTKEGGDKLLRFRLDDLVIKPQKKWDKKWRLVIFDIPVALNYNRTLFVWKLKELGFLPLQKSVWVCPWPCEDEIDFVKSIYELDQYVRVVTAEHLDIESDLKRKFNV